MSRSRLLFLILLPALLLALFAPLFFANAQGGLIQPLSVPIPKVGNTGGAIATDVGFGNYIISIYRYSIVVAAFLALVIMVYGAIKYIASRGNPANVSDAKEWILAGIYGLVLLISAVIILTNINPEIIRIGNIDVQPSFQGYPSPAARTAANARWQQLINEIGPLIQDVDRFPGMTSRVASWLQAGPGSGWEKPGLLLKLEADIRNDSLRNLTTSGKEAVKATVAQLTAIIDSNASNIRPQYDSVKSDWVELRVPVVGGTQLEEDNKLKNAIERLEQLLVNVKDLKIKVGDFDWQTQLATSPQEQFGFYTTQIVDAIEGGTQQDIDDEAFFTQCRSRFGGAYLTTLRNRGVPPGNIVTHLQSGRSTVASMAYYNYFELIYESLYNLPAPPVPGDIAAMPPQASLKGAPNYSDRIYTTGISGINGGELIFDQAGFIALIKEFSLKDQQENFGCDYVDLF